MRKNIDTTPGFRFFVWIGLATLVLSTFSNYMEEKAQVRLYFTNDFWILPYLIGLNYLFFGLLVPRMGWRNLLRTLLYLAATFVLASFGGYAWRHLGSMLHLFTVVGPYDNTLDEVCTYFSRSVASLVFFGIARMIYGHYRLRQVAQQLRIEKQEAELNFLKAQTNPHFLFNTLNNIYSLARDKSEQTPESILRLSELLRFMLYETGGAYIAIGQEVKIIQDYISLEKLRYDDRLRVDFQYEIRDMEQPIPPLLLIPLVENAFKHGASEQKNAQPTVHINLQCHKRQLLLDVKNTVAPSENKDSAAVKERIGLSNLRRQLELQFDEYALETRFEGPFFIAKLTINLDSHV